MVASRSAEGTVESTLAERTAALARSQAELEEMAYAVSHDLRQPLTQVVRFLDLFAEESAERSGKEGARLLDEARASAARLEEMVDAVLRLARIESCAGEVRPGRSRRPSSRASPPGWNPNAPRWTAGSSTPPSRWCKATKRNSSCSS